MEGRGRREGGSGRRKERRRGGMEKCGGEGRQMIQEKTKAHAP